MRHAPGGRPTTFSGTPLAGLEIKGENCPSIPSWKHFSTFFGAYFSVVLVPVDPLRIRKWLILFFSAVKIQSKGNYHVSLFFAVLTMKKQLGRDATNFEIKYHSHGGYYHILSQQYHGIAK